MAGVYFADLAKQCARMICRQDTYVRWWGVGDLYCSAFIRLNRRTFLEKKRGLSAPM